MILPLRRSRLAPSPEMKNFASLCRPWRRRASWFPVTPRPRSCCRSYRKMNTNPESTLTSSMSDVALDLDIDSTGGMISPHTAIYTSTSPASKRKKIEKEKTIRNSMLSPTSAVPHSWYCLDHLFPSHTLPSRQNYWFLSLISPHVSLCLFYILSYPSHYWLMNVWSL